MRLNQHTLIGVTALAIIVLLTIPVLATGKPSIAITSMSEGQTITASAIPVKVNVSNFAVECSDVGKPGKPGQGHVHAMLDGMNMEHLTNFYCSDSFDISGAGLKPGKHVLAVTLANDAHMDVTKPVMVSFAYRPSTPKPLPQAMTGGRPSLTIQQPLSGATVDKKFNVLVSVRNFDLSCDLEGKPNVPGWGHLHVFVQQHGVTDMRMEKMAEPPMEKSKGGMHGGMMSMVGMISMPCTTTVPVDLSSWHSGKAHVMVMLANNDHNPVLGAASSAIDVNVK